MRRPLLALMLALAAPGAAQGPGAAALTVSRGYPVSGFDGIALAGTDDVAVTTGPFAVSATGPRGVIEQLAIDVADGTLRIRRRPGARFAGTGRAARISVSLPALRRVTLAGSGTMRVAALRGDRLEAAVTGSGRLLLPALALRDARLSVGGSGSVAAAGQVLRGGYTLSGSGTIEAGRLDAESVAAALTGSGGITARATRQASVTMTGSGMVAISGGARCAVKSAGSGSITCG